MNTNIHTIVKDELDFKELSLILWSFKWLILIVCIIIIYMGGNYTSKIEKKYTSNVIFSAGTYGQIGFGSDSNNDGMKAIGALTGMTKTMNTAAIKPEEINTRIFIEKLNKKLNFIDDKFFNTYNPNHTDPVWKKAIKVFLGWNNPVSDPNEAVWQSIIKKYKKNIIIKETKSGASQIYFTHTDPNRAADVANAIMNTILSEKKISAKKKQNEQLNYLSKTLSDALNDLETAQSKLKTFALKNSALPLADFAQGSFQLDNLRRELSDTQKFYAAANELLFILNKKVLSDVDYSSLRIKFPIVDSLEFRKIIGLNENRSSWTWPKKNNVNEIVNTLNGRILMLQSKADLFKANAGKSSVALETYGMLKRNETVAETKFNVLINQVETKNMMAGFQPENHIIYEYATPAIIPSEPKLKVIMLISGILGLVIGCILAILISIYKNVFYSKSKLISTVKPRISVNYKSLISLKRKSLIDIKRIIQNSPRQSIRDISLEIYKSDVNKVIITSLNARLKSIELACIISSYMQYNKTRIAILDFSKNTESISEGDKMNEILSFKQIKKDENISLMIPLDKNPIDFLSSQSFMKEIDALNSEFDFIFMCADNSESQTMFRAFHKQEIFNIVTARTEHTKIRILSEMISQAPIQGLFYE